MRGDNWRSDVPRVAQRLFPLSSKQSENTSDVFFTCPCNLLISSLIDHHVTSGLKFTFGLDIDLSVGLSSLVREHIELDAFGKEWKL
jgi:hypothetical protein